MDHQLAVSKIYNDIEFNPACFNFTEQEARKKKLWRDKRSMPTEEELQAALEQCKIEQDAIAYKDLRKNEYIKQGLALDSFVEMLIEGDDAAIAQFRSRRDEIRLIHKKPLR